MDKGLSSQSYCFTSSHIRMWELDYKETECQRIDAFSPYVKNWLIGKDSDTRKDWRQEDKGIIEDETVGWHHQQDGHEFEQALDVGDGQGSLVWCSPWGCKRVGHDLATELNWTEPYYPVNPLLDVYLKEIFFFLVNAEIYMCPMFIYSLIYNSWDREWKLLSRVWLFANPWTLETLEFSRPEYWIG